MNKKETMEAVKDLIIIYDNRTESDTPADTLKKAAAEMGAEKVRDTLAALVIANADDGRITPDTLKKAHEIGSAYAEGEYLPRYADIHRAHLDQLAAYMFRHFDEIKAAEGEKQPETVNAAQILEAVNDRLTEEPQTDEGADFVDEYGASDSPYICDAFSEFADGRIDIYTDDLLQWAAGHYDDIDEARAEGLTEGADFLGQIRGGQYLAFERALYQDERGIIQSIAREYLRNTLFSGTTTTAERLADALDNLADALDNIDSNDRLDAIADAVDDFRHALTGEEEEENDK